MTEIRVNQIEEVEGHAKELLSLYKEYGERGGVDLESLVQDWADAHRINAEDLYTKVQEIQDDEAVAG